MRAAAAGSREERDTRPRADAISRLRALWLTAVTVVLLTSTAVAMLLVGLVTLFQAHRFYTEVMARWLGRTVLGIWGIDVRLHSEGPLPENQAAAKS